MGLMKNGILKYWWIIKFILGLDFIYKAHTIFYYDGLIKFLFTWCGIVQIGTGYLWMRMTMVKGEDKK